MTKLYYITHPSVNLDKLKLPHEWGLSEKGFDEAKKLIEMNFWKEVDKVYSSFEPKSWQVADLVNEKYGLEYEKIQDLGEADRTKTPFFTFG